MKQKITIEFKWALISVLLSAFTLAFMYENWGGGFEYSGFQGIGHMKGSGSGLEGYEMYVIPVGLVPALAILLWQYIKARKQLP